MGHGHDPYADLIPKDHTIYDPSKVKQLVLLKERLAKKGLKDPWMRNEVYRYQYKDSHVAMRFLQMAGGVKCIGLGALIGAVGAVIWNYTRDEHHHEGGDGGHH